MKIFVAIDDSLQLDGGKAGVTASLLTQAIEDNGWGKCTIPSRHRLYPHPDTGCKKHNTARSFSADIEEQYLQVFIDYACKLIKSSGTPDSNAGLAIAVPELMENTDELLDYAYRVKEGMVSKNDALAFADKPGIYLFELSGSGKGIIGALAAAGLRITGNDGQFRGKLQLSKVESYVATVSEIIYNTYVEQVKNMEMENIGLDEYVRMGEKVKVVLLDNKYTLMVFPTDIQHPKWQTSTTHMLRVF
ncbi:MAG: hypothetical protein PHZ03_05070 [Syntrophomonas sp.]|nr:hypothetical protein [Syntrophomonas sp.]